MKAPIIYYSLLVALGFTTPILAQSTEVTFNLNLKPQLEDSTFIPGRDLLMVVGDLYPLKGVNPFYLTDTPPVDSVYSITVRFPSRTKNQSLIFNFEMLLDQRKQKEMMPRSVLLSGGELKLDPLYFNSFAW